MKKWLTPKVVEEQFTANSNVSVCYSLTCTLPGDNPYTEDGSSASLIFQSNVSERAQYNAVWGQQTISSWGEIHNENCALPARYNEATGVFKETGNHGAKVSNIIIDKENPVADGKYPAIWTSHYKIRDYHHMGYAVDDSVGHPLRS